MRRQHVSGAEVADKTPLFSRTARNIGWNHLQRLQLLDRPTSGR